MLLQNRSGGFKTLHFVQLHYIASIWAVKNLVVSRVFRVCKNNTCINHFLLFAKNEQPWKQNNFCIFLLFLKCHQSNVCIIKSNSNNRILNSSHDLSLCPYQISRKYFITRAILKQNGLHFHSRYRETSDLGKCEKQRQKKLIRLLGPKS